MTVDQLPSVNYVTAHEAAYAALDALQDYTPAEQVIASALLFLAMSEGLNINPVRALETASRVAKDPAIWQLPGNALTVAAALKHYVETEIKDHL